MFASACARSLLLSPDMTSPCAALSPLRLSFSLGQTNNMRCSCRLCVLLTAYRQRNAHTSSRNRSRRAVSSACAGSCDHRHAGRYISTDHAVSDYSGLKELFFEGSYRYEGL
jgi:hypothetical protein